MNAAAIVVGQYRASFQTIECPEVTAMIAQMLTPSKTGATKSIPAPDPRWEPPLSCRWLISAS
jgi:hypothetical protein